MKKIEQPTKSRFVRANPDAHFWRPEAGKFLEGAVIGTERAKMANSGKMSNIFTFVCTTTCVNGVGENGKGGEEISEGELVRVVQSTALECLDKYVGATMVVRLEPEEKLTTQKGQRFWKIAVYHSEMTDQEKVRFGALLEAAPKPLPDDFAEDV